MTTIRVRAEHFQEAITCYSDDEPQVNLIDLLADAMHWCRLNSHDFLAILATATRHFLTETFEETGELP